MSHQQATNNAITTLAAAITSSSIAATVVSGTGALFPSLPFFFIATLVKANVPTVYEIVKATASGTDSFSILRGQENTAPQAWSAGDTFALFPTAGGFNLLIQPDQLQAQSTNYAIDTGTANIYIVALNPAMTAHVVGQPIRWLAGHTNTAASTFNDGTGAAPLTSSLGAALKAGSVVAGAIYTCTWDGAKFELSAGFGADASYCARANNLSDVANAVTARTNLGANNAANLNAGTLAYARMGGSVDLATDGFEVMPSGRIIQWGVASATGTSPITVTYPTPFLYAVYNIQATSIANASGYAVESVSLSQFQINTQAGTVSYYWQAIGS